MDHRAIIAQLKAAERRRRQARRLRDQGLTLAQIGARLGVTHQRVSQYLGGATGTYMLGKREPAD